MTKLVSFILCLLFISFKEASAQSVFIKGHDLYTWCNSSSELLLTTCWGYIIGAIDTNGAYNFVTKTCILFDIGSKVTIPQLKDIIVKGLHDNPKERDLAAALLIQDYLSDAFPCPKK
ncbi:MAG: hypothetical protein IPP67_07800 [Rhodospirillaceae bacterium]|nr:hypothetical protein [Rhodospirillaceae bacterium]